jgi:hypothetical protein
MSSPVILPNFGFLGIEYFVNLVEIGGDVRLHLFARQGRTRLGLPAGVADHRSEIAHQKNGGVAYVLKVFQLA